MAARGGRERAVEEWGEVGGGVGAARRAAGGGLRRGLRAEKWGRRLGSGVYASPWPAAGSRVSARGQREVKSPLSPQIQRLGLCGCLPRLLTGRFGRKRLSPEQRRGAGRVRGYPRRLTRL